MSTKRKVLNFDLNTNHLKVYYKKSDGSPKHYTGAYDDIENF